MCAGSRRVARQPRPCLSYRRRRDRITAVLLCSLDKRGGGTRGAPWDPKRPPTPWHTRCPFPQPQPRHRPRAFSPIPPPSLRSAYACPMGALRTALWVGLALLCACAGSVGPAADGPELERRLNAALAGPIDCPALWRLPDVWAPGPQPPPAMLPQFTMGDTVPRVRRLWPATWGTAAKCRALAAAVRAANLTGRHVLLVGVDSAHCRVRIAVQLLTDGAESLTAVTDAPQEKVRYTGANRRVQVPVVPGGGGGVGDGVGGRHRGTARQSERGRGVGDARRGRGGGGGGGLT